MFVPRPFILVVPSSFQRDAMASSSCWKQGEGFNKRKRPPGKGHTERKSRRRIAEYEAQHPEPEKMYDLARKKPAVLSPQNLQDCKFAMKFAVGVEKECAALRNERRQYGKEDEDMDVSALTSSYGFFNKSTILVETMSPKKEGTPHVTRMFGVAGSGKTIHLETFLSAVFAGEHPVMVGKTPSVYVGSISNAQCKNVFNVILKLQDNIPSYKHSNSYTRVYSYILNGN